MRTTEPTVYQAPMLQERQYRATSREIQGTVSRRTAVCRSPALSHWRMPG